MQRSSINNISPGSARDAGLPIPKPGDLSLPSPVVFPLGLDAIAGATVPPSPASPFS
ncbi:hypothetical protein BC826DRAFT_996259 [Russula brevipes]|nr:hypothetical protein BC826DRAFT_996259 [Russula brevipes]